MPITLGITIMIAPETPLFAGRPMVKANSPEKSYIPHDDISVRQFCTVSVLNTRIPVRGQMPPLARVAATTDIISAVSSIEQLWK